MSAPSDDVAGSPPCSICGKPLDRRRFAPFCSRRCADIDLGRWLKGGYTIPGAPLEEAPDTVPGEAEPPEKD
jgi:hypothetical protein